ncbi:MAG TPA: hypothetical protein VK474_11355, partial [Chthoniobacterales bacterium]|nr:hypothetical protein [Chthoniobacterales bacterium]
MPDQTEPNLKLEIAHVLLIDVVGYSKLLVNEQIEVLQKLNTIVRQTAQFRTAEANGKLMRLPTGDGMALLFFDSAETPVECALEISRAASEIPHMQLRMGAHSGPIKEVSDVNDRANFAGAGINTAQRVLDCGEAGHILLSQHLADDLSSYRHWNPYLHPLGECEVKHGVKLHLVNLCKGEAGNPKIPERLQLQRRRLTKWRGVLQRGFAGSPMRKAALAAAGLGLILLLAGAIWLREPPATMRSIAILPFGNLSDDKGNAFFADGMQDEILTNLSKVSGLKVISRTSVMQYNPGLERNLREIAQSLGVSHVLEGSVQRIGNRVRVHAQLIEAKSDAHIWADHYDGDLADVFAIQSEIAERIVAQLRLRLSPDEKAAIEKQPTNDLVAYELYVRAKALIDNSVFSATAKDELMEAAGLLQQAVGRDPNFFAAFYQLAHAHDQLYLRFDRTPARLALAESAIQALQQLRPDAGEAHLAWAKHLYWGYSDYERARAEIAIAQRLLPNDPTAALMAGYLDRRQGRWESSARNLDRAVELDPHNPQNPLTLQQISLSYFNLRRFPEMAAVLDRAVALKPNEIGLRVQRAAVDLEWRADTAPLHAAIASTVANDPAAAGAVADQWIDLALAERDGTAATRALAYMSATGCQVETIPFPRSWCEGLVARVNGDG